MPIIIEIRAGEGGKDSKLFIHDLASAYIKYANNLGLKSDLIYTSESQVSLKVNGDAEQHFQHESGKHCVQRVPPTENKGRSHTSTITVAVLPILEHVHVDVPDRDIEIKTQGGSGPGGQHQNKTDSAVRATHKPTNIRVFINGKDQHSNRRKAIQILKSRIAALEQQKVDEEHNGERLGQIGFGGRSNKIRTYNFIKSRVVDHRLKTKTTQIKKVMKGRFDLILQT